MFENQNDILDYFVNQGILRKTVVLLIIAYAVLITKLLKNKLITILYFPDWWLNESLAVALISKVKV